MDVRVVLKEEVIHQPLCMCHIPIVYGVPGLLNDLVDLVGVGGTPISVFKKPVFKKPGSTLGLPRVTHVLFF